PHCRIRFPGGGGRPTDGPAQRAWVKPCRGQARETEGPWWRWTTRTRRSSVQTWEPERPPVLLRGRYAGPRDRSGGVGKLAGIGRRRRDLHGQVAHLAKHRLRRDGGDWLAVHRMAAAPARCRRGSSRPRDTQWSGGG